MLAAVQQYGVDDDDDVYTDAADTDGETFPWSLTMWAFPTMDSTGTAQSETNAQLGRTIEALVKELSQSSGVHSSLPDLVNISAILRPIPADVGQAVRDNGLEEQGKLAETLKQLTNGPLIVAGAGNTTPSGCSSGSVEGCNVIATELDRLDTDANALIVAGSDPGGDGDTGDDGPHDITVDGDEVDLVAPGEMYVLDYDADGPVDPSSDFSVAPGTSYSAPIVAGAAALARAMGLTPSASSMELDMQDVRTSILSRALDVSTEWGAQRRRLDLVGLVIDSLGWGGALDTAMRVHAVDADDTYPALYAQEVDPSTHNFVGTSADSVSLVDYCLDPGAVEVDPMGDLVYVLCAPSGETGSLLMFHASTLDYLDQIDLAGQVASSTDITVTEDGLVAVASKVIAESGNYVVMEYWDP